MNTNNITQGDSEQVLRQYADEGLYLKVKSTIQHNNHPTCKPIKLMMWLVTLGSDEGDMILDPFAGSGTTCIAAMMLNRKYIGIERETDYHTIAETRLCHWYKKTHNLFSQIGDIN